MFYKYGINSVSTDNISLAMGLSKRTFYQHFESKKQLVELIIVEEINSAERKLFSLAQCGRNAVLEAVSYWKFDLSLRKSRNVNFLRDVERSFPEIWALYEKFKVESLQSFLQRNIRNGITQKYYWADLDEEVTVVLWIELCQLNYSQNEINTAMGKHFIRGLLNQRGVSEFLVLEQNLFDCYSLN